MIKRIIAVILLVIGILFIAIFAFPEKTNEVAKMFGVREAVDEVRDFKKGLEKEMTDEMNLNNFTGGVKDKSQELLNEANKLLNN